MRCPSCYSSELHRSRRGNIWPLWLFVVAVRCRQCGKRFWRRGVLLLGAPVPPPPDDLDDDSTF